MLNHVTYILSCDLVVVDSMFGVTGTFCNDVAFSDSYWSWYLICTASVLNI